MSSSPGRTRREEVEARFVSALPEIERASAIAARRAGLSGTAADDLASDVKVRLIENDYAAFRSFDGRSSFRTYVVTIVHRLIVDRRRREWGRFRPSAEATARGLAAEHLERLLYRDGFTLDEAVETVRGHAPAESRESLVAMASALPLRPVRRRGDPEAALDRLPGPESGNPEVVVAERAAARRIQRAVEDAVRRLPPVDRIALRMRFEDGISVADIARMLRLDQKRLYRRIDDVIQTLRRAVHDAGLGWHDVQEMVEGGRCHVRLALDDRPENGLPRPSQEGVEG